MCSRVDTCPVKNFTGHKLCPFLYMLVCLSLSNLTLNKLSTFMMGVAYVQSKL